MSGRPLVGLWCAMQLRVDTEGVYANHPTEKPGEWSQNGDPERRDDILYFLDRVAEANIDRIYPSIHPGQTGHEAYPDPAGLPDALAMVVEEAHQRSIEVHPYLAVFMLPNQVRPDHPIALRADELTEITRDGEPAFYGGGTTDHGRGRIYSYGYAAVRKLISSTYAVLANSFPIDGVMLDYIRYPGPPMDANETTVAGYAKPMVDTYYQNTGVDPHTLPNNHQGWVEHRAEFVTETIREICEVLPLCAPESLRPHEPMEISACTGGLIHTDQHMVFRDWRSWVRQGVVDTLCPMLYFEPEQVGRETRAIRETLYEESGYSLYSALCVKYDLLNTPALLREGYEAAIDNGADGVCIYRADGLENTGMWGEVGRIG